MMSFNHHHQEKADEKTGGERVVLRSLFYPSLVSLTQSQKSDNMKRGRKAGDLDQ